MGEVQIFSGTTQQVINWINCLQAIASQMAFSKKTKDQVR